MSNILVYISLGTHFVSILLLLVVVVVVIVVVAVVVLVAAAISFHDYSRLFYDHIQMIVMN